MEGGETNASTPVVEEALGAPATSDCLAAEAITGGGSAPRGPMRR